MKKIFFNCLVISLLVSLQNFGQYKQKVISSEDKIYLSHELIIKFKNDALSGGSASLKVETLRALDFLEAYSAKKIFDENSSRGSLNNIFSIKYKNEIDPLYASQKLKNNNMIEWIEPRYVYEVEYTPNDPLIGNQWGLNKVSAFQAWDVSKGDSNIVIGIVDTGVDWDHPDLNSHVWINYDEIPSNGIDDDNNGFIDDIRGWDFGGLNGIADNNPMEDRPDHGTHVAGIASAVTDNGTGIAGLGFNCKIMAIKTSQDDFRNPANQPYIVYGYEGILYAADNGARVINCSWGGGSYSIFGQEIINYAATKNATVVAAAGNSNSSSNHFPSGYDKVLSVASSDQGDLKSSFSNYGTSVDVSAPGEVIYSTWQNDTYSYASGTSMASPLVAGLAGLVAAKFPNYNAIQVAEQIRVTSDNIDDINPGYAKKLGKGRVNAYRAVTETNAKSVRAYNSVFIDDDGNNVFISGDAISLKTKIKNYLTAVSGMTVSLESTSPYLAITQGIKSGISLNTFDSLSFENDPFRFSVVGNPSANLVAELILHFNAGTYNDYQSFSIVLNPTFFTQKGNDVELTITSKGTLAFNDFPNNLQGRGFRFNDSQNHMFEGALMLATSASQVSDAARRTSLQNNDFAVEQPFVLRSPGPIADMEGFGIFNDNSAGTNKIGLQVKLFTYSFNSSGNENFIILRYRLLNTTANTISNLYAGLFFDWDMIDGSGADDFIKWDSLNNFGYVYHVGGNPNTHIASALLSLTQLGFWAILNQGGDGGFSIFDTDGFSDADKWMALSSGVGKKQAGAGDVSNVISTGPISIQPNTSTDVAFAIVAAENLTSLTNSVSNARTIYDNLLTDIKEVEGSSPTTFELFQNYPNPFNPSTVISYQLSASGNVSLKIFDVLGNEVATLIDNEWKEAGNYNYQLRINNYQLTTGVYFYRLQAGAFVQTKKLILLR